MQENNSIPQQIISFFKNKLDIFKNKLLPKPTVPIEPTAPTQTCVHTSTSTPSIYISSFNINHHNNIEVLKTKIQPDIITVTTTMTTTVTTIHNTQSKEVEQKLEPTLEPTLEPIPIQSTYKQYIDCSKYSNNIISSLIDNIIDNIELIIIFML